MPQTEEEYRRTFESEKSRTVVLLGFLSMVLTARAILKDGDFWNFPWWCDNSCEHLTLLLVPTFTNWIYSWFGYIVCMLIYFSDDKYDRTNSRITRDVREFLRRMGHRFIYFYPVTVIFFSAVGGLSFQLADSIQGPYWLTVFGLFVYFFIRSAEDAVGEKFILGQKESVFNKIIDPVLEAGRAGTEAIGDYLVEALKRISAKRAARVTGKRAAQGLMFVIELITVSVAYLVLRLEGMNLAWAFAAPLYAFLVVAGIIGWRVRRRKGSETTFQKDEDSIEGKSRNSHFLRILWFLLITGLAILAIAFGVWDILREQYLIGGLAVFAGILFVLCDILYVPLVQSYLAYQHPTLGTIAKFFGVTLLILNSIIIPTWVLAGVEGTQSLNGLQVDCNPVLGFDPSKENMTTPYQFNRFNTSILLDNPTPIPLHVEWSLELTFNESSVVDSGFLTADLGWGEQWARMQFVFQEPYRENITIASITLVETESVPKILAQGTYHRVTTLPLKDATVIPEKISLGNFTANRLSNYLSFAFSQNHSSDSWHGYPYCYLFNHP